MTAFYVAVPATRRRSSTVQLNGGNRRTVLRKCYVLSFSFVLFYYLRCLKCVFICIVILFLTFFCYCIAFINNILFLLSRLPFCVFWFGPGGAYLLKAL